MQVGILSDESLDSFPASIVGSRRKYGKHGPWIGRKYAALNLPRATELLHGEQGEVYTPVSDLWNAALSRGVASCHRKSRIVARFARMSTSGSIAPLVDVISVVTPGP